MPIPDPPVGLAPKVEEWPAGKRLWHVYRRFPGALPLGFSAGAAPQRFRPVRDGSGAIVPTFYAADQEVGAFFETLFRRWNEASVADRVFTIGPMEIAHRSSVELSAQRPLRLARLHGVGLSQLRVTRAELIEPAGAAAYAASARWGQWIWERPERFDGLSWVSRRSDDVVSCMLFGDRVRAAELELVADRPLDDASGFVRVQQIADDCGLLVACSLHDVLRTPLP